MYLTDEEVTKFQMIYQKSFGKELSREEALEWGIKLARMFEIIYKPMTKADYAKTRQGIKELKDLT